MALHVTLLPGDGAGPENADHVAALFAAAGVDVAWERFDTAGDDLPAAALESARRTGLVLKGHISGARKLGRLPATVRLRKELGTWATVRPVQALPGCPARFPKIDLVVVRETSEDIYSGMEHEITDGVYEAVKVTTAAACTRIARHAFELARRTGRKKVTIVHKSNIMKKSDGLFLRTGQAVGAEYPDIVTDEVIVDALCMKLVRNPGAFDVLLCGNLFGDIVSDLCSGLAGGMVAAASMSTGDGPAIFEKAHGQDPALRGTDRQNPLPLLQAGLLLLAHSGEAAAAERLRAAMVATCEAGVRTADQGGTARASEVVAAIRARL